MSNEFKLRKNQASSHDEARSIIRFRHEHNDHQVEALVNYAGEFPWLEIRHQGRLIHEGAWLASLEIQGQKLPGLPDACTVTCFSSDSDGVYIELAKELDQDLQLDYTLYLPKKYPFLLMACFVNNQKLPGASLETILPGLSAKASQKKKQAEWRVGETTTEISLKGGDFWQVLPVTIPQFRTRSNHCKLELREQEIIQRTIPGTLPLAHLAVITWEESKKQPATWKQVEVGFGIKPVQEDQAVAWRFRVGKHQFLFYRSFVQTIQPRSALGLHTNYESVLSTINKDGFHRALICIEREEHVG